MKKYISPLTEEVQLDPLMVAFGAPLSTSEFNGGGL